MMFKKAYMDSVYLKDIHAYGWDCILGRSRRKIPSLPAASTRQVVQGGVINAGEGIGIATSSSKKKATAS